MAYTKANQKAVDKYCKKVYDSFLLRMKKGQKEQIQRFAEDNGMSLNGYINKLIAEDMGDKLTASEQSE